MQLKKTKFHFIGIGGIGMCGLAELLHNMGAVVTGSDLSENANTERLSEMGVKIYKGHDAKNVGPADVVVFSSAVKKENPEVQEARRQQIPLIPRAEALAEIMRLKRGLAVAGTHGKTTTTSMTAAIFLEAQLEPTIVVGGRLDLIQSTARLGTGQWLVAEADESDGSFQKLTPEIAIITNIDNDHLDYYHSVENLQKAFHDFALKVPFYGSCIVCGDDALVRKTFDSFTKRIYFYGFNVGNDFRIQGSAGDYELFEGAQSLGRFRLNVPGHHNALNATAAIISGLKAGIPFEVCRKGLMRFQGVDRRFHFKGIKNDIQIYDDYGHHPTEVKATLQAFREKYPKNRIVVLFQPHRFSRTQSCWDQFLNCFEDCDQLLLTDIYPAGEVAIAGVDSSTLKKSIQHKNCYYLPKSAQLATQVQEHLKAHDIFVTLGAGDAWKIGMEILNGK